MFSAYHLSEQTAKYYIKALNDYQIPWIHGYPSTLSYLAGLKKDLKLPDMPSLKIITTGAESLLQQQKSLIESVFGVSVKEHYGMAEGVANISEGICGSLHVDEDFAYVEFIPVPGEKKLFKIIGTNWSNPSFPMLRYDTGDVATVEEKNCGCKYAGRTISYIDGRIEDFVVLPSGARVGRLDHIFKDMVNINAAQIYQPDNNKIVFKIVPGRDYDKGKDEKMLLNETRKRLGNVIAIDIEYSDEIQKTKTGKVRFVISDLKENKTLKK